MTVPLDKPFYSIEEAAALLELSKSAVSESVRTGRTEAIQLGATLATARIPRSEIFRDEKDKDALKNRRQRRMFLDLRDKLDALARKRAEWLEAEREVEEAFRTIEHEFALDDFEAMQAQTRQSLRAV